MSPSQKNKLLIIPLECVNIIRSEYELFGRYTRLKQLNERYKKKNSLSLSYLTCKMEIIISTMAEAVTAHRISTFPRGLEVRQDHGTSFGPPAACHFWAKAFQSQCLTFRLPLPLLRRPRWPLVPEATPKTRQSFHQAGL